MRTDNQPTNFVQSIGLSSNVQGLDLSNQLFSVGNNNQSFDQILNSQVQERRERSASNVDSAARADGREAKRNSDSGNHLPDDGRLEKQQRAEREDRDRRADAHSESKSDQEQAVRDKARTNDQREAHQAAKSDAEADSRSEKQSQSSSEPSNPSDDSKQTVVLEGESSNTEVEPETESAGSEQAGDLPKVGADEVESEQAASAAESDIESADTEAETVAEDSETVMEAGSEAESVEQPAELVASEDEAQPVKSAESDKQTVNVAPQMGKTTNSSEAQTMASGQNNDAEDSPRPRANPGFTPATGSANTSEQSASVRAAAADSQSVVSSTPGEGDELGIFEPKSDKKADPGIVADKLAMKQPPANGTVPTPVQERLAALAKALDKAGSSTKATQSVSRATEQVDSVKATPFQRSLEQVGRVAGQGKPLMAPLQAPMQSREWGGELAQRLVMMVSSKLNSAQIQVNPREMGPIDVRVSVQHDQANVVFTSQAAPTRDALEQAMPRLREMMEQNGVALGDVDVRDQDTRESHEQAGQDQQQGSRLADNGGAPDEAEGTPANDTPMAVGLVDYYA